MATELLGVDAYFENLEAYRQRVEQDHAAGERESILEDVGRGINNLIETIEWSREAAKDGDGPDVETLLAIIDDAIASAIKLDKEFNLACDDLATIGNLGE